MEHATSKQISLISALVKEKIPPQVNPIILREEGIEFSAEVFRQFDGFRQKGGDVENYISQDFALSSLSKRSASEIIENLKRLDHSRTYDLVNVFIRESLEVLFETRNPEDTRVLKEIKEVI